MRVGCKKQTTLSVYLDARLYETVAHVPTPYLRLRREEPSDPPKPDDSQYRMIEQVGDCVHTAVLYLASATLCHPCPWRPMYSTFTCEPSVQESCKALTSSENLAQDFECKPKKGGA